MSLRVSTSHWLAVNRLRHSPTKRGEGMFNAEERLSNLQLSHASCWHTLHTGSRLQRVRFKKATYNEYHL